ncbi:helix-turn-helix transcriptional regulator [Salmonella enterica subsp. enterica serovar Newport]
MFNVKRNGASVEITEIPASIPFSVFKNIADETGATETLVSYFKDKTEYEVIIQQTSENMAATVGGMAKEVRKISKRDVDVSTIGKRIGFMRVKRHMYAQELEDAIGAPEGSVFRWETGKAIPSDSYIKDLALMLECDYAWLRNGENDTVADESAKQNKGFRDLEKSVYAAQMAATKDNDNKNNTTKHERWIIDISGDNYKFTREINGEMNAEYCYIKKDLATVYAILVINGFEPPVHLKLMGL